MTQARPVYISPTQLGMYERCPAQYEKRYIEGLRYPPGIALIRGKSVHVARDVSLRHKMNSEESLLLPLEEIEALARDEVVAAFADEVVIDEDMTFGQAKGDTIDAAVRLARLDYNEFHTTIDPLCVEEKITVEVPGLGRDILGILDVADTDHNVHDCKTSTKTPAKDAADKSEQLSTYALLHRTRWGSLPPKVCLDALVDLKSGPKAALLESTRTMIELDALLERYYAVIQAIDKGVFPPCSQGSWVCSPRFCGYFAQCKYVRR
ncbi:MAG: RecB family exonuclease [Alphaproteobacteria bacterium]